MQNTPKSLRTQILLAGRVNSGKSSLVNLISGQDVAITSCERGTTTDVVEKAMELRPLGPVLLLDTAGTDDDSQLGKLRVERTAKALDRADILLIVTTSGIWGEPEEKLFNAAQQRKIPAVAVVNKCDDAEPDAEFLQKLSELTAFPVITATAAENTPENRERLLNQLVPVLLRALPEEYFQSMPLLRDLLPANGHVVMMVPIDTQAPKGRLILPQVQAIRDALDGDALCTVAKAEAFPEIYSRFSRLPDLVICDSQVVKTMIETIPEGVPCTTFSILMARLKGDLKQLLAGADAIKELKPGDRILVAEACTHHAGCEDIGRVKIPAMLQKKCGGELKFDFFSGNDFPADMKDYRLVVHCGGCMLNRRAMLNRLAAVAAAGVPVVNYGICISYCTGVLPKVLSPFK